MERSWAGEEAGAEGGGGWVGGWWDSCPSQLLNSAASRLFQRERPSGLFYEILAQTSV